MANIFDAINPEQRALIEESKLFFVASVAPDLSDSPVGAGPLNLSPKGGVPLHVIDERCVAYLDYQGSGNETSRHAAAGGPVTIMVMSISDEDAGIVRLYGHARITPLEESPLAERLLKSAADDIRLPQRQVVEVAIEKTQTSCGYGVPILEFVRDRTVEERGRRYKSG